MSLDPYAAEWEARGFPPDHGARRCAEARAWLERAREGFEADDFTRAVWQSRLAAIFATRLPAEVAPGTREESEELVKQCRALDEEARRRAPEQVAAWEASWQRHEDQAAADHLLHLQQALQGLREAPLAGLRSVSERIRRRRAAWLLGRGLRELVERHAVAPERFFQPAHEAARSALRELLEARERQTKEEDAAWRAKPSWDEPPQRKEQVDLRRPAGPPSVGQPLDDRPLVPFEADVEDAAWSLDAALRRLDLAGDDALRGFDACDVARYRARQLRSFPAATEAQLERAQVVMGVVDAWLAWRSVAEGPSLAEWKALRIRMHAAQVEAQLEALERIAAELHALPRREASRRRRVAEAALSRRESSIASGTLPPMLYETERFAAAEAALRRAWAERVERPT